MGVIYRRRYPFTLQPLPPARMSASAGDNQALHDGHVTASLVGSVEGGIGPHTIEWSRVSGDPVTFSNASSLATTVTLTGGNVVLRLTVHDATRTVATDDVAVTASQLLVDAGADQDLGDFVTAELDGIATGGNPPYVYAWTVISGSASFADATAASTTATVTASGTLRLTVTDANLTVATDDVSITTDPVPATAFGAALIDYWMADRGVGFVDGDVDEWVGQTAGMVLASVTSRPAYTTSDTHGNSQPSVNCSSTAHRAMYASGLAAFTALNDHFAVFCVARYRDYGGVHLDDLFGVGSDSSHFMQMHVDTGGAMKIRWQNVVPQSGTGTYATTTRLYYMVAQTNNVAWCTGSTTGTTGTGYDGVPFAATQFGIGCGNLGTDWADVDIFETVLVLAPTAPQIAAYALAVAARYGAVTP